jgi:hypothetical protein
VAAGKQDGVSWANAAGTMALVTAIQLGFMVGIVVHQLHGLGLQVGDRGDLVITVQVHLLCGLQQS